MDAPEVLANVREIADEFAADLKARQLRTHLDPSEFARLAEAGFTLTGVPADQGGLWSTLPESTRPICEILRTLAHGDSSVALVSSMHASVLAIWLASPVADAPFTDAWEAQRREWFETARQGAWWGTITSESGSGGDVFRTKAVARPDGDAYRLSGAKQFGSGSGISSYMITTAKPEGPTGVEDDPDVFVLPVGGAPWDGSTGMRLVGEWDGHGMIATQSHAMVFEDFPAIRSAWEGNLGGLIATAGTFFMSCFAAVVLGVAETAMSAARDALEPKQDDLRAYERVEWAQATQEAWLAQQAYEGMLRAVEGDANPLYGVRRGKIAIAQLVESALTRVCRVVGGGTFGRQSPFGCWFEDVRALGFLRPPWGFAFDGIYADSWER